jgi:hypothetical protein
MTEERAVSTHGHPVVDAAWKELLAIHGESGGGDAFHPNKSPEYLAAHRMFVAVLDAHRVIICQRRTARLKLVSAEERGP